MNFIKNTLALLVAVTVAATTFTGAVAQGQQSDATLNLPEKHKLEWRVVQADNQLEQPVQDKSSVENSSEQDLEQSNYHAVTANLYQEGALYSDSQDSSKVRSSARTSTANFDKAVKMIVDALSNTNNLKQGIAVENPADRYEWQKKIDLSSCYVSVTDMTRLFEQVINQNPDLFYIKQRYFYSSVQNQNIYLDSIVSCYQSDATTVSNMKEKFDAGVAQAMEVVQPGMATVDKLLAFHEYIVSTTIYDVDETAPNSDFSAYGIFVENTAVCQGYALAYSLLMNKLGLENTIVSSQSMNHAWNLVKLDGQWYHIDATHDDPLVSWENVNNYQEEGNVDHERFLVSDARLNELEYQGHKWGSTHLSALPKATDRRYENYFWRDIISIMTYKNGNWIYAKDRNVFVGKQGTTPQVQNLPDFTGEIAASRTTLYYTTSTGISCIDINFQNTQQVVKLSEELVIIGMGVRNNKLYYETVNTDTYTYHKSELDLAQIEKLSILDKNRNPIASLDFFKGDGYKLSASGVSNGVKPVWSSSNNSVVAVGQDGSLTAIKDGTATITIKAGSQTASCTVTAMTTKATIGSSGIKGITPGSTTPQLLKNLRASGAIGANDTIKVTNAQGSTISASSAIGTGMRVSCSSGAGYTVVITGDVDGNGLIDVRDITSIKNHILGRSVLEGAYFTAAQQLDSKSQVDVRDIVVIKNHILGRLLIDQSK